MICPKVTLLIHWWLWLLVEKGQLLMWYILIIFDAFSKKQLFEQTCRKVTIVLKSEWVVVVVLNSRFLLGICHLHNWTLVSVLGRQEEAAAFMLFLTNFQPWHRFTMCLNAQHFSWIPLCCDVLLQKILQSCALIQNKERFLIDFFGRNNMLL